MSAIDWMQIAVTAEFQLRVQAALYYMATSFINEEATAENHAIKVVAATKILNGMINVADFSKLVATDETLRGIIDSTGTVTDIQLLAAVQNSLVVMAKASL